MTYPIPDEPTWAKRLNAGAEINQSTGCHEWNRGKNNRGYGVLWMDGKLRLAHRVAFYGKHGRWPAEGMVVDHSCDNKGCVNPDHLREMPNWRNLRRPHPAGTPEQERQRERWRAAHQRSRGNYSSSYRVGR